MVSVLTTGRRRILGNGLASFITTGGLLSTCFSALGWNFPAAANGVGGTSLVGGCGLHFLYAYNKWGLSEGFVGCIRRFSICELIILCDFDRECVGGLVVVGAGRCVALSFR